MTAPLATPVMYKREYFDLINVVVLFLFIDSFDNQFIVVYSCRLVAHVLDSIEFCPPFQPSCFSLDYTLL